MALIITPSGDKKIYVQGTSIELASVYARVEFGCRPNGVAMEIAFYTYADHTGYVAANSLPTDLPVSNITVNIDPLTQTQGLQSAHDLAKAHFEALGYIVSIDLV